MKYLVLSFIVLLGTIHSYAAESDSLSRNLDSFHALVVFGNIKVEMKKADKPSLVMTSKTWDISKVTTMVEKGVLTLKSNAIGDEKEVMVTLYYKSVDNIKIDAGANIVGTDTIKAVNLTLKLVKGSLMRGVVKTENLIVTLGQGSEARISGATEELSVTSNSGSKFDSYKLISQIAEVKANTGGKVNIFVKKKIKAKAKTGSVVNYKGHPKIESVEPTLGGEINKL